MSLSCILSTINAIRTMQIDPALPITRCPPRSWPSPMHRGSSTNALRGHAPAKRAAGKRARTGTVALVELPVRLLGQEQGVIDFDAEVTDGAFQLGVRCACRPRRLSFASDWVSRRGRDRGRPGQPGHRASSVLPCCRVIARGDCGSGRQFRSRDEARTPRTAAASGPVQPFRGIRWLPAAPRCKLPSPAGHKRLSSKCLLARAERSAGRRSAARRQ